MFNNSIQAVITMFYLIECFFSCGCFSYSVGNVSLSLESKNNGDTNTNMLTLMSNCSLYPKYLDEKENIAELVNGGYALVKISIEFEGSNGPFSQIKKSGHMFRPYDWTIITSVTGQRMLLLKEYFITISIKALGLGVVDADLTLGQNPADCLKDKSYEEIENSLRHLFLRNFEPKGQLLLDEAEICNRHVKTHENVGQTVYVCCHEKYSKNQECSVIEKSNLMRILFLSISILKWISIFCFPLFIPYYVYEAKNVYHDYHVYDMTGNEDYKINIMKMTGIEGVMAERFVKAKIQSFTSMEQFKKQVKEKVTKDKKYTFGIEEILISVRNSNIIGEGCAPVSVLGFLSNFFGRCKLRHVINKGDDYCKGNVFPRCCNCNLSWNKCMQGFMVFIMVIVLFLPFELRLLSYFLIERTSVREQKELMKGRNLSMYTAIRDQLEYPITYALSSDLWFIVIIIYSLISLAVIFFYKCVILEKTKEDIKYILRKSIRDMRLTNKSELCSIYMGKSVWLLNKTGIAGLLIFPFWFVIICIPLSIELIPTFSLIGQIIINFKEPENKNTSNQPGNKLCSGILLVFIVVLILLLSLVLVMECLSFYVELSIYILVGFILNPYVSLKYASLIFLVVLYGHECFKGVYNRYVSYNNTVIAKLKTMVGESLQNVASLSEAEQENTVFAIPGKNRQAENMRTYTLKGQKPKKTENSLFPFMRKPVEHNTRSQESTRRNLFSLGSEGFLKLNIPRLVLFMDKSDFIFIPKSFLFKMANLPHNLCPGSVHMLYFKAAFDFSLIVIFLVFVFVIIMAFGKVQNISTGGQTIAALGSGLIPLFLRRIFFRSHETPSVDSSDLQWQYLFENAVQEYSERWNFVDICLKPDPDQISNTNCIDGNSSKQSDDSVASSGSPTAADSDIDKNNDGPDESTKFFPEQNTETPNIEHIDDIDLIFVENEDDRTDLTFYVQKPFVFTKND